MISSAEQYEWVRGDNVDGDHPHGDLDRIIISGDIMPLRPEDEKNILRGEDIAFLLESAEERQGLKTGLSSTSTFTRKVTVQQYHQVASKIDNLTYDAESVWVKEDADIPDVIIVDDGYQQHTPLTALLSDDMYARDDFLTKSGDPIDVFDRKRVENMFSDVLKMKKSINRSLTIPEKTGYEYRDLGSDWGPQQPSYTGPSVSWYFLMSALFQDSPTLWNTIGNPRYERFEVRPDMVFTNICSKNSFLMLYFKYGITNLGDESPHYESVYYKVDFSSSDGRGNYFLTNQDLVSAAKNALQTGLGIPLRPLPQRQYNGQNDYQQVEAYLLGSIVVSTLRDKTIWTI